MSVVITSSEELEENVARGAAWLDEKRPGWHWCIDLDMLDINDLYACICGQVFRQEAEECCVGSGFKYALSQEDYRGTLTQGFACSPHEPIWKRIIEARREAELAEATRPQVALVT